MPRRRRRRDDDNGDDGGNFHDDDGNFHDDGDHGNRIRGRRYDDDDFHDDDGNSGNQNQVWNILVLLKTFTTTFIRHQYYYHVQY